MNSRSAAGVFFSLFMASLPMVANSSEAANLEVLRYATSVDQNSQIVSFDVTFDRAPDFFTVDEHFRQRDSVQFWVDSTYQNPVDRAIDGLYGRLPPDTQSVISAREIPLTNQLEIIWVTALTDPRPQSRGGWGVVVGDASYTLSSDNTFSFELPLSQLRDNDGTFYYSFAAYGYGGGDGLYYSGISGETYLLPPIPEPSGYLLMVFGVGFLALVRRHKRRPALA